MKLYKLFLLLSCLFFISSCSVKKRHQRYIDHVFKEIKTTFPEASVQLIKDCIKVIFPNNILFSTNSFEVLEGFNDKLVRFAGLLNKFEKTKLLITGHTDNVGDSSLNLSLSLNRADAIKKNLITNKVNEIRLFTWGLGDKNPIEPNDSETNRALNRRVEFIVLYNEEQDDEK